MVLSHVLYNSFRIFQFFNIIFFPISDYHIIKEQIISHKRFADTIIIYFWNKCETFKVMSHNLVKHTLKEYWDLNWQEDNEISSRKRNLKLKTQEKLNSKKMLLHVNQILKLMSWKYIHAVLNLTYPSHCNIFPTYPFQFLYLLF